MNNHVEQLTKNRRSGYLIFSDRKAEQQAIIDKLDFSVKTHVLQLAEEQSWTKLDKYHRGTTEDWISMDREHLEWYARFCSNRPMDRVHYGLLIVKLIDNFTGSKTVLTFRQVLDKAVLRDAQFMVGIADDDRSSRIWKYSDSTNEYVYPNLKDTLNNAVADYYSTIDCIIS
jgi:hypothetical protein